MFCIETSFIPSYEIVIHLKCMFTISPLPNLLFFLVVLKYHISPLVSDGKTYDAYILYPKTLGEGSTSNSDIFVFKILPEVLEKQCGYKLFIYGRDDYAGEGMNVKKEVKILF